MHAGRVTGGSGPSYRLLTPCLRAGRAAPPSCRHAPLRNGRLHWRHMPKCSGDETVAVNEGEAESQVESKEEQEGAEGVGVGSGFVPVMSLEELPKGERREVTVDGKEILVFWYRNEIWACEARSPTEGAYSIGFKTARFTENFGIECPETGTVFSIKNGGVLEWYPNNPVLKTLIPSDTCRELEVYPIETSDGTIYTSFEKGSQGGVMTNKNKGGAKSSLEGNNVFFQEPAMYIQGSEPGAPNGTQSEEAQKLNPVTVIVGTVAVAIVSVAGTALAIFNESIPQLIGFWVIMLAGVGTFVYRFIDKSDEDRPE